MKKALNNAPVYWGDLTGVTGDLTDITGDLTNITGNLSNFRSK